MDVSCPTCHANYSADDAKLRGKTARMRCKACKGVWLVTGPAKLEAPTDETAVLPTAAEPIEEFAPASRRAAVVRKGAEREKRDLFAEREPDVGSVKEALPPPSYGFTNGVGARNENSVLFRVDQILGSARTKTARNESREIEPSRVDEEGVIDLKALSSAPPPALRHLVAPLFSEAPPVTVDVDGSKRSVFSLAKVRIAGGIAAGAALLAVTVFGVSAVFRTEEPVKHAAVMLPAEPPPPPPAIIAPPPVVEAPAATTDDASSKEASTSKVKKGKGYKAAKGTPKSGFITNKTPAPAPKPVKAADPCHCKGDFNCILACTARGGK